MKVFQGINPLLFIIILTVIIYGNSLNNDFWAIDDPVVMNNPHIQHFTIQNLKDIFNPSFIIEEGTYYKPFVYLSFSLEYLVWKNNPFGYHLTNLIIFIISLVFIYLTLELLFKNTFIPFATTLLFAVHPVHSEAVLWISSRTHLLSALFCLISFYCFIRSAEITGNLRIFYYFLSLLNFVFALFSHPFSCVYAMLLLLYFYCFPVKLEKKYKITFILILFFIGSGCEFISFFFQHAQKWRLQTLEETGIIKNLFISVIVLGKYCKLLFWPVGLSAIYKINTDVNFLRIDFIVSLMLWVLLVCSILYSAVKDKELFFAFGWFIIFYIPVSHIFMPLIFNMADRYLYFPGAGIFLLCSILLYRLLKGKSRISMGSLLVVAVIIICLLSVMTYERTLVWKDSLTLCNDILSKYDIDIVYNHRGYIYNNKGEYEQAIDDFNRALSLNPELVEAYYNRGSAYFNKKDYDRAISDYTRAINLLPEYVMSINARGMAYLNTGEYNRAIADFTDALNIDPSCYEAYNNRAFAYYMNKEYDKALEDTKKIKEAGYNVDPNFLNILQKKANQ